MSLKQAVYMRKTMHLQMSVGIEGGWKKMSFSETRRPKIRDAFLIDTLPHTQKEKCHKSDIDQVISEQTHQKGLKIHLWYS